MNKAIVLIWVPMSERVGTIEVEKKLINFYTSKKYDTYNIGITNFLINKKLLAKTLLGRNTIRRLLGLSKLLGGRITVFLQSFLSLLFFIVIIFKKRPNKIIVSTCLYPIPILLLKLIFKFINKDFKLYVNLFIQGTPSFAYKNSEIKIIGWRGIESSLRFFFYKKLYPLSDRIITSTPSLKEKLYRLCSLKKSQIIVLPNGIIKDNVIKNYDEFNFYKHDLNSKKNYDIYYVGRLTKQKNIELLIREFLKSDYKKKFKAKLKIIGNGEYENFLNKKYKNQEEVKFYGFLPNPWERIPCSSIVIVPSLWDEPGHVPLEALSLGHRVFVSNGCSLIDFFSERLIKLSTFNPYEISKLLNSLHIKSDLDYWEDIKDDIKSLLYKFSNHNFEKIINQYTEFL